MKRFTLLFTFIGIILGTANTVYAQYCTTGLYTTGCTDNDYINSFSTTGGITNITNNNTACSNMAADAYTFFSSQTHTAVQGTVVDFSYTNNTTAVTWAEGYKIWIDYNENGSFEDAGELVYAPTTTTPAGATVTGNFTVPFTVAPGNKRLRIRCVFNTTTFTSCSSHTFGEAEDYNFVVVGATPCAGPPTAGTANAVPGAACLGEPISLTVTGTSITTSGLAFQWQVSTDNTNWNDISGATTLSATTTQAVTSYYRFRAVCTNTNDTVYTASVQVISPPIPSGNYTINKNFPTDWPAVTTNANFNNFNDAYNAVKCGIGGAVVFNVVSGTGPYNEQLIINGKVGGASATNTITFNGNGNTIAFASTNTNERAVIKLKGAKYFIFDSLTVDATAGTYGFGFHLINDADSNVIRKCIINSSTTSTNTNFAGLVISGADANAIGTGTTLCDDNKIDSNTINGGYYGITLTATFAGGANGRNLFTNNDVKDFYQYGMYVNGSYNTLISKNRFSRPTRTTVGEFNGIYFTAQSNTALITKNRIYNPFGGAPSSNANFFGINFSNASASSTNDNQVYNNLISDVNGNGAVVGIANTGSGNLLYFHNTISLDNITSTASANTRGIQLTGTTPSILLINNIVTITRGGTGQKHCIYLGGDLPILTDYNDYYINAAGGANFIGFYTGNRSTLANLQTATGQEASSLSVNPVYSSPPTEYAPVNAAMDNKGLYVGVDDDILDNTRVAPDIGAYEFTPPPCSIPPVLGTSVVSPLSTCQNTPIYLNLNIGAFGSGQTFQWQASSTLAGPYTPVSGNMLTPDTTIQATTTLYYRCAVSCASATEYSDTVLVTVNPAFPGGTYTINSNFATNYIPGQAPPANFNNFNDAKNAMAACGILGPVVFNVEPGTGPYNEQLILDSIKGVSAINTITFNGNGNTIAFNSVNSNERAVIKLKGADHITFDSLTINASGGTYGYGVQLISNADSNTFRKCNIITSSAIVSTNYAGVVINSSDAGLISVGNTLCDGNTFDRDTITGGYYGVTLVGSTTALLNGNKFTNNYISEFYSHGFYSGGTTNTLIEHNTFTRPARTVLPVISYGIQFTSATTTRARISKNRFTKFFGGASTSAFTFYGIHFNSVSATAGNENIVSNNAFYDIDHNGPIYALYNSASDGALYYHNTIALDNTASTSTSVTAGFYQVGTAVGIQFKNNIVSIRRGGTGQKHAIFLSTAASEVEMDYNDYYINAPGVNNFIGYNGVNRKTLTEWQTATTQEANSLDVIPLYTDPVNGDFTPNFLPLDNKGVNLGFTTDILERPRVVATPDIGAFEFTPTPCTAPPVAGTASVSPSSGICLEAPIHLTLTGNSPIGTITFQWESSPDGTTGWTPLSGVLYSPDYDTVTTTNNFYRCAVTCNGVTVYSTVTQVTLNSILLAGTYTIDKNNTTTWPGPPGSNFSSFGEAVSALLCGITGPVTFEVVAETYNEQIRIPYIPNTSSVNTVTFKSQNGNASSVNLTYNATNAAANYTVKLDSARYFIFKNLSISATNASNGRAVELAGTASYDSILNCIITAPVATTSANTVAGIFANGLKGGQNVIRGNTVSNGSSGIYFAGTSIGAGLTPDNIIDSNTVSGAYYYGIYAGFNKKIKLNANTINVTGPAFSTAYGLYATDCDSSYEVTGNSVNVTNTSTTINGIYINNCDTIAGTWGKLTGNTVTAMTGNTGILYGMYINNSPGINVLNNAIAINTTGASSYGLYNNNSNWGNYWNNSVNSTATSSTNNYAAYFINTAATNLSIRNNIFSHKGGGKAMFATNTNQAYGSDYNMLYTSGTTLAQRATPAGLFATLKDWTDGTYWDRNSIRYNPAFVSNSDLHPDLANSDVWAIHGRGIQIPGNSYDFNNNNRPTTLTAGVPDLGAFEFYPTALPTVLLATPAVPAAGITQTFSYGTDTVMRLTWTGAAIPPSVEVRRYSGVVPSGLPSGMDSMYFYTEVDIPGGGTYDYDAKLVYIDPWQGSIPDQHQIGLGRTTPSNAWVVGFNSFNDVSTKTIRQNGLSYLDKFTGLVNPYAPPVLPDADSSNRGKRFWVGYQKSWHFTEGSNAQDMVLYLSATDQAASVQVKVNGTNWVRNYYVAPNSTTATEVMPKAGIDDARLLDEGLYNRGISIISDVPITAYAHIYASTNSGATMLFPVGVWGYEYYSINNRQNYTTTGSYTTIMVIADKDNTVVEITPSVPTLGGRPANVPFTVTLNAGDVYQVLGAMISGSDGYDLTGSVIKSIPNSSGECHSIGVFSGSSRTGLGCGTSVGGTGDLLLQQTFPYSAWGKTYYTAPTSTSGSISSFMTNIYRVMVKDPATVVQRNGVTLTTLVNNRYYQFESNTADKIVADKPVTVVQYMSSSGSCPNTGGDGDPSSFILSSAEQAVKGFAGFYRNNLSAIDINYLTFILPDAGMTSLKIDGISWASIPAADKFSYPHPNAPGYTVAVKKWAAGAGQSSIESDSAYLGLVYGLGNVESYGYNVGTLVKTLNATVAISNTLSTSSGNSDYTCMETPFQFKAYIPLIPTNITWKFSQVPNMTPNADYTDNSPTPTGSVVRNGITYYEFTVPQTYTFSAPGIYSVQIDFEHPDVESCDHKQISVVYVQVLPGPKTHFDITFSSCVNDVAQFDAQALTENGLNVIDWQWIFHDGTTVNGQNASYTYNTAGTYVDTLRTVTPDGCIGTNTAEVVVNSRPVVDIVPDSVAVCSGTDATFDIQNPDPDLTYSWFTTPTGGTAIATGASFTPANITTDTAFYAEAVSLAGCASIDRKKVIITVLSGGGTPPTVTVTASGPDYVTFSWIAVPGATYEASVDGGAFVPVSGPGATHTVAGLGTLQSVSLVVKAIGGCGESLSAPVSGCTNSPAAVANDSLVVCNGSDATFDIQSPGTGITYTWYNALTGGTSLGTGSSFTFNSVTSTASYYVEQQSASGCTGSPRTRVIVDVLPPLTQIVAVADSVGVNRIRFAWNAVPGAASYEVSTDGGATFITPSSGPTGLFHVVTGLAPLQQVTLIVRAIGAITCQTSTSLAVSATTLPDDIFIPNTFTPNGDGINDEFRVYGAIIQEMNMMVFDQWGEKVFHSRNLAVGWDGRHRGKPLPSGVYIFVAQFVLRDGTVIKRQGALNLIR